jgi:ADP-ribose pyrophosphatase YjhB (NUDIX family)
MHPKKAYRFCPKCSGRLVPQNENFLKCSSCRLHFYINPAVCNAVILENKKGEILLVKRKFPPKKDLWDLPGGFIQPNETLEQSIKREIKEELNVDITMSQFVGVYPGHYLYQNINYPTLCVVVSAKMAKAKLIPKDDVSQFRFFGRDVVLKQKIAFGGICLGLKDYLKLNWQLASPT